MFNFYNLFQTFHEDLKEKNEKKRDFSYFIMRFNYSRMYETLVYIFYYNTMCLGTGIIRYYGIGCCFINYGIVSEFGNNENNIKTRLKYNSPEFVIFRSKP